MVGVGLRDDANKSFVACNVYALARLIVKHVVGVSNRGDFSNDFPCISVEHNYLCRLSILTMAPFEGWPPERMAGLGLVPLVQAKAVTITAANPNIRMIPLICSLL
jgi:hypothetical protein